MRRRKKKSWRNETLHFAFPALLLMASIAAAVAMYVYARGGSFTSGDARAEGATIYVKAGDDLQRAIDRARPGDTLMLEAGASFRGTFTLPDKSGDTFITIRSAAKDSELPAANERIDPARFVAKLPKISSTANGEPAIKTAPSAHHFRFVGIEFGATPDGAGNIIALGAGTEKDSSELPHHIEIDRCFIHGDAERGQRRGIALNGRSLRVINSYIAEIKRKGEESQGLCGWNGEGPFEITNNYIEAAGENILFGGADPTIPDLVPSDIEVRRNRLSKPLAWRGRWDVKNLFELKNARRVTIEGNLMENNWADAQGGTAILFTVRNQDGNAPWSVIEDVTFTNNIVRHAANGVALLGQDYNHPSQTMKRVRVVNNLFYDIGEAWGKGGKFVSHNGGEVQILEVAHNTAVTSSDGFIAEDSATVTKFSLRDNILHTHLLKSGAAGVEALRRVAGASGEMSGNVFIAPEKRDYWQQEYPPKNFFLDSFAQAGIAHNGAGVAPNDFRLAPNSPARRRASDGADAGVDFDKLMAASALSASN